MVIKWLSGEGGGGTRVRWWPRWWWGVGGSRSGQGKFWAIGNTGLKLEYYKQKEK